MNDNEKPALGLSEAGDMVLLDHYYEGVYNLSSLKLHKCRVLEGRILLDHYYRVSETINRVKQHKLEKRLKRTDLTEKERLETGEELGHVRIVLAFVMGPRKR